jgi:hypothetical protein
MLAAREGRPMPVQLLIVLAVAVMAGLATLRLVRVHLGRTPLPEGRGRRVFLLAFALMPPIVLGALTQPAAAGGQLSGLSSLPIYVVILATLMILMRIVALIVGLVAHGRSAPLLRLALTGSEGDPVGVRSDPPVTAKLAEDIVVVDKANAVFPRGREFPAQIDRAGFRADWGALDSATRTLEGRIADDHRLGRGVASVATATAMDARGRLDTLRRLAVDQGQAWAAS